MLWSLKASGNGMALNDLMDDEGVGMEKNAYSFKNGTRTQEVSDETMDPKEKGELSEAKVVSVLMERGYTVSIPFGENTEYDVIADDGDLHRVQIKTGKLDKDEGVIKTDIERTHVNSKGNQRKPYEDGDVDAFIVYCHENECAYWFDESDVSKTSIYIRVKEPERWSKAINWHENHLL